MQIHFNQHLYDIAANLRPVSARLIIKYKGELNRVVYSGFLGSLNSRVFWITAGHVLQEFERRLDTQSDQIDSVRLFLNSQTLDTDASQIPIPTNLMIASYCSPPNDTAESAKIPDIGFIEFDDFTTQSILQDESIRLADLSEINDLSESAVVGYILIGSPQDSHSYTEDHFFLSEFCLGAQQADPEAYPHGSIALDSYRFAKLVDNGELVSNICGMSGSPVFAIIKTENTFSFHLAGVQSAWTRSDRMIKFTWLPSFLSVALRKVNKANRTSTK